MTKQRKPGDVFTIAGVYVKDSRNRWQRVRDWILRRPAPARILRRFTVSAADVMHIERSNELARIASYYGPPTKPAPWDMK